MKIVYSLKIFVDHTLKSKRKDSENAETLRGFIYPEHLRSVHRDVSSKFYLDRKTYEMGTYPVYPAGGAYIASSSMVYLLLRLMRKYELFSFPFEGRQSLKIFSISAFQMYQMVYCSVKKI